MTRQIIPLDVSVNGHKYYLRKEYEDGLLSENLPLTTYGEIKRTSASELAEWISVT
jgi:hypothetical protein